MGASCPAQWSRLRRWHWAAPLLQFVRGQTEKLSVDLFFDTTDDGTGAGATSVTTRTDPIYSLVKIEPAGHAPTAGDYRNVRSCPDIASAISG